MTVLEPRDDHLHPIGPEPNFNESMYFQFHDSAHRIGGFLRLANRPNEGRGERTVCLYLPGGSVAFGFARPTFADNSRFRAGGLSVDVLTPFQHLDVCFEGRVNVLSEPAAMVNPKAALSTSPAVECRADLRFTAAAPPFAETFDGAGESFAPNHYEQLMCVSGTVRVGADSLEIDGHGLRDHSWGPRSWQAPWFYRWMHGSSEGMGFMGAYFGSPDNTDRRGGFVWDGDGLHTCDDVIVATRRDGDQQQSSIDLELRSGQRRWSFHGEVDASVPLRHRSQDGASTTRIVESSTTWTAADGKRLHGMAEYLDQLSDGVPVGLRV
jgi:hypothetical protein